MEETSHQSSSYVNNNPLFSSIVTFYILILLYFPQFFLKIILSPLLISTLIILLSLLRLGASQQQQHEQRRRHQRQRSSIGHGGGAVAPPQSMTQDGLVPIEIQPSTEHEPDEGKPEPEPEPNRVVAEGVTRPPCNTTTEAHARAEPGPGPEPVDGWARIQSMGWAEPEPAFGPKRLVEWDVGAPLEVIYEAYEGEEEGEQAKNDVFYHNNMKEGVLERYPSLSRYYPDTDSDSDSDSGLGSSSSSMTWDEEYEDKEGLIEIALDNNDNKKVSNVIRKVVEKEEFCIDDDDEDNLIEIDIFPTKNMGEFA